MAHDTHNDIETFVQQLRQFHDSLPQTQQAMLEAIIEAAEEENDTAGHMMSPYMVETSAKMHMADLHREADQARSLRLARQRPEGEQGGAAMVGASADSFARLSGWLSMLFAHPRQA